MLEALGLLTGLGVGIFSFRYRSVFIEAVVGIAAAFALLGPKLFLPVAVVFPRFGGAIIEALEAAAAAETLGGLFLAFLCAVFVGAFVGRIGSYIWLRSVQVPVEPSAEAIRARTLLEYGYLDEMEARMGGKPDPIATKASARRYRR